MPSPSSAGPAGPASETARPSHPSSGVGRARSFASAGASPDRARASGAMSMTLAPAALLCLAVVAALALGARAVDPGTTLRTISAALTHGLETAGSAGMDAAAVTSRVPRTVTAAVVGAALAVAGAALQGATRNPLGDPGLLGLSSGAALAMAIGLALGAATSAPTIMALAALGTLLAAVLVYGTAAAARRNGGAPAAPAPPPPALAGAAGGAGATACTTALLVLAPPVAERFRHWTVGTVARADLGDTLMLAPVVAFALAAALAAAPGLDALALGDDLAHGLGARPARTRAVLLASTVLLTAAGVALAGPVAFVGLVVPHALRRLRPSSTRLLLLGCALWGAVLLVAADAVGRVVLAPAEIHVGVSTVLLGVPVLLVLLNRRGMGA